MVVIKLNGRQGNQMFQYAFAIALANKFNTTFHIDGNRIGNEIVTFFDVETVLRNYAPSRWQKWMYHKRNRLKLTKFIEEDVTRLLPRLYNHAVYDGFFQNESYFLPAQTEIRKFFQVSPQHQREFQAIQNKHALNKKIVIHARLKDYLTWEIEGLGGPDLSLPTSYYRNAIHQMGASINDPFILVSDDVDLAMQRLSFLKDIEVINYTPHIRFQVLMHATRLIISNSSFAWWAAWLNPNQPQVLAPKHWLGFKVKRDYPYGIMPKAFTPVDF